MVPLHGLLFYFILGLQLTISEVMARFCGGSLENECVLRPNCKIGTENGKPIIDFQELQGGNRGCATTETCCPKSEVRKISSMNNWYPFQRNCGNVNSMGLTFTIRGFDDLAQEAELPWMVALLDATRLQYKAAGSLIAPDVVLTATHVTQKVNEGQLIVRAGEWDFNTKTEQQKHVDVAIRKIVRHPDFSISTGANNVALLFLEGPLELSRHINIICLPPPNRNFIRDRCFVSGWGKKHIEDNNYMNILKKIEVPIVDRYTCERQLHELLRYSSDFRLDDTLMCAGGEIGKDSCDGDGGAPLFCPIRGDPQRFEQAGIVAFGIGCGEAIPAVYTDVSKMSGWITQQIEANLIGKQPQPNYGWKNTSIRQGDRHALDGGRRNVPNEDDKAAGIVPNDSSNSDQENLPSEETGNYFPNGGKEQVAGGKDVHSNYGDPRPTPVRYNPNDGRASGYGLGGGERYPANEDQKHVPAAGNRYEPKDIPGENERHVPNSRIEKVVGGDQENRYFSNSKGNRIVIKKSIQKNVILNESTKTTAPSLPVSMILIKA
ncbi:phenoloxidase-activating factor 1-like [Drosophila gunungcola]|uniref:phenoloxidase-activating factor 1-like n=1 Tax=Drosophila gunungcola TaxID=103775 RepID=UPI0022E0CB35|nr:phenoloxidase-activating factor 1-like [Drosophila gunungcola]